MGGCLPKPYSIILKTTTWNENNQNYKQIAIKVLLSQGFIDCSDGSEWTMVREIWGYLFVRNLNTFLSFNFVTQVNLLCFIILNIHTTYSTSLNSILLYSLEINGESILLLRMMRYSFVRYCIHPLFQLVLE